MKFGPNIDPRLAAAIRAAAIVGGAAAELGYVEDARRAWRGGTAGFLVRGYIYYNQVHFIAEQDGAFELLYTSVGDDYAEDEFARLSESLGAPPS